MSPAHRACMPGSAGARHSGTTAACSAFSMIELLVVVSIIAILAALLLPAIGIVRAQAKAMSCASALRQIGMCSQAYGQDWEGMAVPAEVGKTALTGYVQQHWYELLATYAEVSDKGGLTYSDSSFTTRNILVGCSEYTRDPAKLQRVGYGLNHRPRMPADTANTTMFSAGGKSNGSGTYVYGVVSAGSIQRQSTRIMIACSDEWSLGTSSSGPIWSYGGTWGPHRKQRNCLAYDLHIERLHSDDVIQRIYDPSTAH